MDDWFLYFKEIEHNIIYKSLFWQLYHEQGHQYTLKEATYKVEIKVVFIVKKSKPGDKNDICALHSPQIERASFRS